MRNDVIPEIEIAIVAEQRRRDQLVPPMQGCLFVAALSEGNYFDKSL